MAAERQNKIAVSVVVMVACMLLNSQVLALSNSTTYVVGDDGGWTFGVHDYWPKPNQTFKADDVLEFKYDPSSHNVVVVNKSAYDSCILPSDAEGAETYQSGDDKITLKKGPNYYICGIPGHCNAGMKVAIIAE